MKVRMTNARARRIVARAKLPFQKHVADPRDTRGRRHAHAGLLGLIVVALMVAKRTLRATEDLASDLGASFLGLKQTPSDSTLYRLLQEQEPEGFRDVLQDQVRRDVDSKAIKNDLFPGGLLSFDGKGACSGYGPSPNPWCRSTVCDEEGTKVWNAYTLRAALTSSSATPYLDLEFLDDKTGETSAFPDMFGRLVQRFPQLFRYVSGDAEFTSAQNASIVRKANKHYVFGLKKNRRRLYDWATRELETSAIVQTTTEPYQGYDVRRELRRVRCSPQTRFPDAKQVWAVRRVVVEDGDEVEVEERLFITSIPWSELPPRRILRLVRLHWRIENNANWTADVVFGEDSGSPCQTGNGAVVFCWLLVLALNLVAIFRAKLPTKDNLPTSWARTFELLYQAFLRISWTGGQHAFGC